MPLQPKLKKKEAKPADASSAKAAASSHGKQRGHCEYRKGLTFETCWTLSKQSQKMTAKANEEKLNAKTRESTSDIKDGNSKIKDNPQQPLPTQTSPTDIPAYGISLRTCVFPEATRRGHRDAHYGWTCRARTTPLKTETNEEKLHAKDKGTYQRHRRWQRETQIEKHMKDQVTESKKATANNLTFETCWTLSKQSQKMRS